MLVLANFTEHAQMVPAERLLIDRAGGLLYDLVTGEEMSLDKGLFLVPYRFVWLV